MFDTDVYPTPNSSPFDDITPYIGLLLGAVDAELDRDDAWAADDVQTALGYIQDLKAWIADLPMPSFEHSWAEYYVEKNAGTAGGATVGATWTPIVFSMRQDANGFIDYSDDDITLTPGTYRLNRRAGAIRWSDRK